MSLQIEFFTEDEAEQEFCKLYWQLEENGKFSRTVAQGGQQFNISGARNSFGASKVAASLCRAHLSELTCPCCGKPVYFSNRSDFQQRSYYQSSHFVCSDCRTEIANLEAARREAELERQRNLVKVTFAVEERHPPDLHSLSFDDAIYLLGFICSVSSELQRQRT